jgi:phosphopantothenoylcysteine decarboxylase/phosphopantothenate--cysteine ligase
MKCLVTAGPTYEPLDQVRRLTNFSTGRLGSELAAVLAAQGYEVTLLLGHYASVRPPEGTCRVEAFTTAADLEARLAGRAGSSIAAVFHAAAVCDFTFGPVFELCRDGSLRACGERKLPTGPGRLLAELVPTPKILPRLRHWFPQALLVGWKYEVDGTQESALSRAAEQVRQNQTGACVANGPAYGPGYGVVTPAAPPRDCPTSAALHEALLELFTRR